METLRSITSRVEGLLPPFSLRKVGRLLGFKGNISLRELCQDNGKYARIYVARLTLLQQNMGLLVWPASYAGTERDKAIQALTDKLQRYRPDIVGLQECFSDGEREGIKNRLRSVYPYSHEAPDEVIPDEVFKPAGGLLLLSRYPIIDSHQTIYRQCCGEDCVAKKGVLHARIVVPRHPVEYDIFLTHMQNCPPKVGVLNIGKGSDCWEKLNHYQVVHLNDFVQGYSDPHRVPILMGDFNHNGLDADKYGGLIARLQNPDDLWMLSGDTSKHGITSDSHSSFGKDKPARPVDDPARHQAGYRFDYFFTWSQGRLFAPVYADTHVVVWQSSPGRDISDHYGVWARQTCVREVAVDQTRWISNVQLKLSRYRCLLETKGSIPVVSPTVEDDEVEFMLLVQSASGFLGITRTDVIKDLNAGSDGAFADANVLNCGPPGDWLDVTVQAWEVDVTLFGIETGRASLGPTSIRLDRKELCSHLGQRYERVLPILTGDGGGEYAVAVEINVG